MIKCIIVISSYIFDKSRYLIKTYASVVVFERQGMVLLKNSTPYLLKAPSYLQVIKRP